MLEPRRPDRGLSSRTLALSLFGWLAPLVGCADGPHGPPATIEPAELTVFVRIVHATEDHLGTSRQIRAELDRGLRSDGSPHPFVDDTLWVMDRAVLPSGPNSFDARLTISKSSLRGDLVIRAPELVGLDVTPVVRFPLAHRSGRDTTRIRGDRRPIVRLTVPLPDASGGLAYERWGLELPEPGTRARFGGRRVFLARSGIGPPPEVIPFPDEAMPMLDVTEGDVFYIVGPAPGAEGTPGYRIVPSITVSQFFVFVLETGG